jgi:acetylornithine deacetylase
VRWLPGSAIPAQSPLVTELAAAARSLTGAPPAVEGIEGPCGMYIFQEHFGIPAVLWGARGGNTHGVDEYVEIDSLVTATPVLLLFVCNWCGVK